MIEDRFAPLAGRAVLAVAGDDRRTFLQGLISNDVEKVAATRAVHAAFLTAQGRFLHEFFLVEHGDALLLEAEAERLDDLRRRLSLYRLRAKVAIERRDALAVFALFGDGAAAGSASPRSAAPPRPSRAELLSSTPAFRPSACARSRPPARRRRSPPRASPGAVRRLGRPPPRARRARRQPRPADRGRCC